MAEKSARPKRTFPKDTAPEEKSIMEWILSCRDEAEDAKETRMVRNRTNYDMYHLRHNFDHKAEGQSTEILSKVKMAVEQIKSFFQQSLTDVGEWWRVEARDLASEESMPIRPHEITKLTNFMLDEARYFSHVGDAVQVGLLGALSIGKVRAKLTSKPKFRTKKEGKGKSFKKTVVKVEDKTLRLKFDITRQENYYPDPTGNDLYEIEDMWLDKYEVMAMAEGKDAIYDKAAVDMIPESGGGGSDEEMQRHKQARETGQNNELSGHRPKVKITEFWGNILDRQTGKLTHENVVCTLANDRIMLRKPTPNPLWHQKSPYVRSPLMEVANSVWHTAPMDAPVAHNRSLIELYNLFVDAAMKQTHAISQLRKDALDNQAQVSNGIKPGATLIVNSSLPHGAKVLEPLTDTEVPNDALEIFNIMNQEFNASALTNDLRQGVMPFRAVKATEVVEASQTITSVFQGMAKNFESKYVVPGLELAWMTIAQNWDSISLDELTSLFGDKRGRELHGLDPQDVFVKTVNGFRFRVFGITLTLNKAQDFQKWTTLLQTISASDVLVEAFAAKHDFGKLLDEIMNSLNLDKHKIELPIEQTSAAAPAPEEAGQPGEQPDEFSQVEQPSGESLADILGGGGIPQSEFPGSPATAGRGQ